MKIKKIDDYYEQMYEKYPNVPKQDIRRILQFGWKSLYLHNSYGGDVIIRDQSTFIYFGRLMKSPLSWFNYYKRKLSIKVAVLFKRRNKDKPWNGCYYFGLSKTQGEEYFAQIHRRGRKKKYFTFGPIILYKIKEECITREADKPYIFEVAMNADLGYHIFKRSFRTGDSKLILTRDGTFQDLLIANNNYEYV